MDRQIALANILRVLQQVKSRPSMYFGFDEPEPAGLFLIGFSTAAGAALGWNYEHRLEVREAVTTSRGWAWTAVGPYRQMIDKRLASSEIVVELIEIEAEYIQRMTEKVK